MYFIPQITQNDCAFTCLKMLLANSKNDKNFLFLKEDESHGNYSYLELTEIAFQYGVKLIGFKVEDKNELKKADQLPMILTIKIEDSTHAVLLYKVTNNNVYFYDPQFGKKKCKFSSFVNFWEGNGLLIDSVEDKKVDLQIALRIRKRNIVNDLFQFVVGTLLVFGIFSLDTSIPYYYSIGALGLGFILEVVSRLLLLKRMKKFDSESLAHLDSVDVKYYSTFLSRKEKYKTSIYSNKNNIFFYLFICVFIIFVILYDSPWNFLCIFFPLLCSVFYTQILDHYFKNINLDVERKEVNFSKCKSSQKAKRIFNEIHATTYSITGKILFSKFIGIVLFGICAFVSSLILQRLSIVNVVFLFIIEIYFYTNLVNLLSYENLKNESKVNYLRYINILNTKK